MAHFPWPHYDDTTLNQITLDSHIRCYPILPSTDRTEPEMSPITHSSPEESLPLNASPSPAPGYSIIAQTLPKKVARVEPTLKDSIDDWEMIDPDSLGNSSDSSQADSLSSSDPKKGHVKRNSFIERRASSHMEEVEKLAVQILGPTVFAASGLNLPSTSTHHSIRTGLLSASSSDTASKKELEAQEAKNPFLRRNIRAVEIMTTEAKYLMGIEHVLKYALGPLQAKEGIESETINLLKTSSKSRTASLEPSLVYPESALPDLSKEEIRAIFGNLESLYVTNCNLLLGLLSIFRTWQDAESTLGQLFHYYAPLLKVSYSVYLSDLSNALANINILRKREVKFEKFLSRFASLDNSEKRPLSDFISTPLQRVTRYEVLLAALEKETPKSHPDKLLLQRASDTLHKALNHINKSPLEVERRAKLVELQARFAAGETILDSARLLILDYDEMRVRYVTDTHYTIHPVFLFTDSLLIATTSYSGYLYKQQLFDLHSTVVMDRPHVNDELPSIWLLYPMKTYTLAFADVERKNNWMTAIAEAIAVLVSKSPEREKSRHRYVIHLFENNIPLMIPAEAQKDPQNPAWTEIKTIEAQVSGGTGFFATIRSWFGGAPASSSSSQN